MSLHKAIVVITAILKEFIPGKSSILKYRQITNVIKTTSLVIKTATFLGRRLVKKAVN